jgi:hypothetical protein
MTQLEKLVERFWRLPPVTDFRWEELVRLMTHYGFSLDQSAGGSHCHFICHEGRRVINCYRPHPSGVLYRVQIRELHAALKDWGY